MKNPYKPGAGTAPEYLAGRDKILEDAVKNLNELGCPLFLEYLLMQNRMQKGFLSLLIFLHKNMWTLELR